MTDHVHWHVYIRRQEAHTYVIIRNCILLGGIDYGLTSFTIVLRNPILWDCVAPRILFVS